MTVAITRDEIDARGLRKAAARNRDARAAGMMLALAMVLEGADRRTAGWTVRRCGTGSIARTMKGWTGCRTDARRVRALC